MRLSFLFAALVFLLLFSACSSKNEDGPVLEDDTVAAPDSDTTVFAAYRERAATLAAALDNRQLAAQVIISGIDGRGAPSRDMRILLGECPVGGIILFRYNLDTENDAIRNLITETSAIIEGIPPFVALDHEGGAVNRFRTGMAALPSAGSYWELALREGQDKAISQIEADSFQAGSELKDLGFSLNLAPVAEYITDDNREFLDDRAYGPDPGFVAEAAGAFVRGMERAGLLCAVKHFPGSAGSDPHRFPSILRGDRAALDELIVPFTALIGGGLSRALMAAHSMVPARDSGHIASLSSIIIHDWLREELGFEGIIISDDFSMGAVAGTGERHLSPAEAAVQSLAVGVDMVLVWPPDIRRTHSSIVRALDEGRLSPERLREAAARIIFEKLRFGLFEAPKNGGGSFDGE